MPAAGPPFELLDRLPDEHLEAANRLAPARRAPRTAAACRGVVDEVVHGRPGRSAARRPASHRRPEHADGRAVDQHVPAAGSGGSRPGRADAGVAISRASQPIARVDRDGGAGSPTAPPARRAPSRRRQDRDAGVRERGTRSRSGRRKPAASVLPPIHRRSTSRIVFTAPTRRATASTSTHPHRAARL